MRYGESRPGEEPSIGTLDSDSPHIHVLRDVTVSLYRTDDHQGEVFPPSTGTIAIRGPSVVCTKQRATRVETALPVTGAPPAMVDQVVIDEPGRQWFVFDLDQVSDVGRTMLLRYRVEVECEGGTYEVVLGRGSGASRFITMIDRQRRAHTHGK